MGLFGIRVCRVDGVYVIDALYKMAKGRVVRRAADRVSDEDLRTAVGKLMERLIAKGVLDQ